MFIIAVFSLIILSVDWFFIPLGVNNQTDIHNPKYYIAHAGGSIDGLTYTNCKEALINSIEKGFQYIELDLYMTTDSQVVCLHKLENFNEMTGLQLDSLDYESFINSSFYGKYTPLSLSEAIKIWEKHSFILITDKISDPEVLNKYFLHHRNRVIVEAFSSNHYKRLKAYGYVPMLSLGKDDHSIKAYLSSSLKCGYFIDRVYTTSRTQDKYLRLLKKLGANVTVSTQNDSDYYNSHLGRLVDQVYTDFWLPSRH